MFNKHCSYTEKIYYDFVNFVFNVLLLLLLYGLWAVMGQLFESQLNNKNQNKTKCKNLCDK